MEFKRAKLSEIGEVVGGSTPSTKKPEYYDGNIPWITPKDLAGYTSMYISKGERNITREGFDSCSTKMLPKNSILFSSRAPIGYVAIAENELCTNQGFKSVIPNNDTNYLFLYYLLKNNRDYIASLGSGSTFKEVSGSVMRDIEFDIPVSKNDQIKISKVLYSIDSKIESNNQINNNLSELALTLFKVFIEQNKDRSEKIDLKDCVEKIGTGADAIQRAPIVDYDTGIRCIRVGDMTNNRKYYEWGFTEMTDKDFENYKLDLGDIVVTRTAVNGITRIIDDNEKIVCNNGLIRLKVNNKYNPIYIYMCTKTKDFYDYIHRIDSETSVRPNMKVDYFTSYQIDKISSEKQNEFCNKIDPMLKLQKELEQEIHNLEQLRDTLLPKLMNGEIDLENIEI